MWLKIISTGAKRQNDLDTARGQTINIQWKHLSFIFFRVSHYNTKRAGGDPALFVLMEYSKGRKIMQHMIFYTQLYGYAAICQ